MEFQWALGFHQMEILELHLMESLLVLESIPTVLLFLGWALTGPRFHILQQLLPMVFHWALECHQMEILELHPTEFLSDLE